MITRKLVIAHFLEQLPVPHPLSLPLGVDLSLHALDQVVEALSDPLALARRIPIQKVFHHSSVTRWRGARSTGAAICFWLNASRF